MGEVISIENTKNGSSDCRKKADEDILIIMMVELLISFLILNFSLHVESLATNVILL